ncbi:hypothetical protein D7Z26_27045 [Cohnella endophytica]|uniref:S-layer homology domain-containing protein n=2 Tax=Cohnella endophytica TaxID=2419778 RepID=A0A494WZQ2_9BACL|nr:hypothetical protein D7Z26_27045 [Cohnella endophytica]
MITVTQGTTDASGVATFTVKSTKAEAVAYTAAVTADSVTVTQTASVTFVPGAVSASVSTITASKATVAADGTDSSVVTVTLKDANSNPVSGKVVSLTQGTGGSAITTTQGTTNASGVATFTVKSTKAEMVTYTASVTADSVTVTQTASVTFRSNNANLSSLQASQGTLTPAFASNKTSYTVYVSNATTSIKFTPQTEDAAATLILNEDSVLSGDEITVPLEVGNNIVTIEVTAQDSTTKTYTITVTRAGISVPYQRESDASVNILVNGKVESAGTAKTTKRNDQSVTTVIVDQKKIEDMLAAEGKHAVVTISVNTQSDIAIGELNGQIVKNMEGKQAVIQIQTDRATYTLPAQQINIDAIAAQVGKSAALQDITVQIEIAAPTKETVHFIENTAEKGTFTLVVQPVEFTIRASYGENSVEVSKFNAYVERTIAIPDGVDPNKITTGVVVDPDGTVRHVPTKLVLIDGKYYVKINSLTNSVYSVVWHPIEFQDVANHWAKEAVNDMGSRMIVSGIGGDKFNPDEAITRAEFVAILVRGLGLSLEMGASSFSDVKETDWYASAIKTAVSYHLINGFENGTFRPKDKITREQAMAIIAKAMAITNLQAKLAETSNDAVLSPYLDAAQVSQWAQAGVAETVQAGIVSGRSETKLAPKASITRAEVASIVRRLLQKSELI